jgi:glycosyltransferase involved in cell wall biosynthesis
MKVLIVYNTMEYVWYRRFFLRDLLTRGDSVVAVAPFDGWNEKVESLGIECIDLPLSRWGANPLREISTLWRLYQIMRSEAPDAAILYTIKPVIYGSLVGRFVSQVKIFSLVTGLGYMFVEAGWIGRVRQLLARILYRVALTSNERVFFQNPDDMAAFVDKRVIGPERAILVSGSGVDTEFFKPSADPPEKNHFLLVSRMLKDKGIGVYVAAARRLKKKYPQAVFKLIGPVDDNPAAIPLETLQAWNDEGVVQYLGPVEDIRPQMARCSVYVLPSWYREGIPRTNMEALAMGKPVVTTDMPGCRETVVAGENGFLIATRDEDALVEAMEAFLRDPLLAQRMGAVSRELAVKKFRVEAVNKAFLDALSKTAR